MGLKITVRVCSWGKLWGNRYEKTKKKKKILIATSEEAGAETGCWEQKQGAAHASSTQPHQRGGKPPKPPLRPNPWTHPYPHPI